MPLLMDEGTLHNNFTSNNRIKRSAPLENSNNSFQDIIKQFLRKEKGKLRSILILLIYL